MHGVAPMESFPTSGVSSDAQRIAKAAQDATHHAMELLRAEFALAKDELRQDLQVAKRRALSLALSALLLQSGVTLVALGLVVLWGATATAAFATGSALATLALGAALYGVRSINSQSIAITQKRLIREAQRVAKAIQ